MGGLSATAEAWRVIRMPGPDVIRRRRRAAERRITDPARTPPAWGVAAGARSEREGSPRSAGSQIRRERYRRGAWLPGCDPERAGRRSAGYRAGATPSAWGLTAGVRSEREGSGGARITDPARTLSVWAWLPGCDPRGRARRGRRITDPARTPSAWGVTAGVRSEREGSPRSAGSQSRRERYRRGA